jgi:trk system potassium uptake protein TrkA
VDKDPDFVSINRMLKEKELKPLILHAPFYDLNLASRDEKIRNYALKNMLLSLDFCMETDIPTLVFHTGINPLIPTSKQQGTYELLKLSVREIIKDATKKNISLLVENTYEKVFFYFKKLFEDFPDLKMTLDIGHCHCFSDYSTDQWIAEFKSQIIHYHIHDNDCSEDAHLSLGKGKLPFSTIFPLLDRKKTIKKENNMALECLVIGLGVFGKSLAQNLKKQGSLVVGVDKDEKILKETEKIVEQTIRADSTMEDNLRVLGVDNFDYVFVCIGVDMEASLITTLHLNNLGAKKIIARSNSSEHSLILQRLGAHRVITPEIDSGQRLAQETTSSFETYMQFSDNFAVVQMDVPEKMIGKTLTDMDLRQKYKINVLSIKRDISFVDQEGEDRVLNNQEEVPSPDYRFNQFDKIYVMGDLKNINRFMNFYSGPENAS